MGDFNWAVFSGISQEEYDRRRRELEDAGQLPIRDSNRGVVYVYREYIPASGGPFPDFDTPTSNYIEQRWVMGKAPDRQVWDYGRSELRRVYTVPGVSFKGSGWASKS
jgi:hypothetical protein